MTNKTLTHIFDRYFSFTLNQSPTPVDLTSALHLMTYENHGDQAVA